MCRAVEATRVTTVVNQPRQRPLSLILGGGWSGAASTYFTIDPARHLVIVLMSQHLPVDGAPALPKLAGPFYRQVYAEVLP